MALGITKVTGTPMSAVSVALSSTSWGTAIDAALGYRYDHLVFQASVTFDALATGAVDILLRKSTDGGTTDTNIGYTIKTVDAPSSVTPQVVSFECFGGDYIEVGATNNDATYAATVTITYEGLELSGLD
jgi:hypothetical protein